MAEIILDGSFVHYEALGRGRPVVFLHGWVGSWRYWLSAMQVASRSFRAYGLDLYGFGSTSHYALNYSLEAQATLLNHFFYEMNIGKVAIIGHGLGALVGMAFASRFPQNIDRLMAVSCPLHFDDLHSRLRTASPSEIFDWLSDRSPEIITAVEDVPETDPQAIAASMTSLQGNNLFGDFRALNIPCLLMYGDRDKAVHAPSEDLSFPLLIHSITLERAGHFPMIEQHLAFEKIMMNFLRLGSGMSPREIRVA